MAIPATDVTISEPRARASGVKNSPWRVRVYIRGKEVRSRNFEKRALADQYATRLKAAKLNGETWDEITGEPVSWLQASTTIAVWAKQVMDRDRARLEPASIQSRVEVLSVVLATLTKSKMGRPDERELRRDIRDWLFGASEDMPKYLQSSSMDLSTLDTRVWKDLETKLAIKDDGSAKAARTTRRYITVARQLINEAIDARLITEPLWSSRRVRKANKEKVTQGVTPYEVPTAEWARDCIDRLVTHQPSSQQYRVLAALSLYTGMRPGEARALHIEDITLPDTDHEWGSIHVCRADKRARTGAMGNHSAIGNTKTAYSRQVPVPPALVAILREQIGERSSGLLCFTRTGGMIGENNLARAWQRARGNDPYVLYSLRHLYATSLIANGEQPATVANLLGHSVQVLMSTYTHWMKKDEDLLQQRILSALS